MRIFGLNIDRESYVRLFAVVSMVEASWNQYSIRFEENIYKKIDIKDFSKITDRKIYSENTIKAVLSTSFGLPQIMGFNIVKIYYDSVDWKVYEETLIDFILKHYLQHAYIQFDYFCYFVNVSLGFNTSDIQEILKAVKQQEKTKILMEFAKRYNGQEEYADRLISKANIDIKKFYAKFPELQGVFLK